MKLYMCVLVGEGEMFGTGGFVWKTGFYNIHRHKSEGCRHVLPSSILE